jgi:hypothetical protein
MSGVILPLPRTSSSGGDEVQRQLYLYANYREHCDLTSRAGGCVCEVKPSSEDGTRTDFIT